MKKPTQKEELAIYRRLLINLHTAVWTHHDEIVKDLLDRIGKYSYAILRILEHIVLYQRVIIGSQNRASMLISRSRLESAMRTGRVKWHKDNPDTKLGRVKVNWKDVQKLLNEPGR